MKETVTRIDVSDVTRIAVTCAKCKSTSEFELPKIATQLVKETCVHCNCDMLTSNERESINEVANMFAAISASKAARVQFILTEENQT